MTLPCRTGCRVMVFRSRWGSELFVHAQSPWVDPRPAYEPRLWEFYLRFRIPNVQRQHFLNKERQSEESWTSRRALCCVPDDIKATADYDSRQDALSSRMEKRVLWFPDVVSCLSSSHSVRLRGFGTGSACPRAEGWKWRAVLPGSSKVRHPTLSSVHQRRGNTMCRLLQISMRPAQPFTNCYYALWLVKTRNITQITLMKVAYAT